MQEFCFDYDGKSMYLTRIKVNQSLLKVLKKQMGFQLRAIKKAAIRRGEERREERF